MTGVQTCALPIYARSKSRDQTCLGFALQEGGRRSQRAGGAAVVIEHDGCINSREVISDLHTTEFRVMLTLMVKVMNELPSGSDILFLTNVAYIQNFDYIFVRHDSA